MVYKSDLSFSDHFQARSRAPPWSASCGRLITPNGRSGRLGGVLVCVGAGRNRLIEGRVSQRVLITSTSSSLSLPLLHLALRTQRDGPMFSYRDHIERLQYLFIQFGLEALGGAPSMQRFCVDMSRGSGIIELIAVQTAHVFSRHHHGVTIACLFVYK
jgi:hypothetical protein